MSDGQRMTSLRGLLDTCLRIEIPLIQRDYAQGRDSENEVRYHFLRALHEALLCSCDGKEHSLNLDFVYGTKEAGAEGTFFPLDGQQRLTTLFLLHWYLGWRDGRLNEFQALLWDGRHSRFTYCVRPSGTEFFDELVRFVPTVAPDDVEAMRALLEDQPWFFLHWRLDPTIQSALVMLDAIHSLFRSTSGLFGRLVEESPAITFQLLPLENFGLTDDLYIKMNARGRPLTTFETFKARFEELLVDLFPTERRDLEGRDVGVAEFFEHRMDTVWTDFFWAYKNSTSNTFDDAVMNLVLSVARMSLDPDSASFAEDTTALRAKTREWTFSTLHERGWLSRAFAENLVAVLEAWSRGPERSGLKPALPSATHFDEAAFFEKASRDPASIDYLQLVQFAALTFYLREHELDAPGNPVAEWLRVVSNLATNSDIERPEQYGRSLAGLRRLVTHGPTVLQHLVEAEIGQVGFSPQQVQEEVLKAKLLSSNPGWRWRIDRAESHGYFTGQIEFLLDFCGVMQRSQELAVDEWSENDHQELQAKFDAYSDKAMTMFDSAGLTSSGRISELHLWKRALLATGDYMARIGSNRSFLTNPPANPDSWKRYLRNPDSRRHLKILWDKIDVAADVEQQLTAIITSARGLEPWRSAVITNPEVIGYCGQQEVRWSYGSKEIYLLSKRQMNGAHAELFSYAAHLELAGSLGDCFSPLILQQYQSTTTSDDEPFFSLSSDAIVQRLRVFVQSWDGKFHLSIHLEDLATAPELFAGLLDRAGLAEDGAALVRVVARDALVEALQQVAEVLQSSGKSKTNP